MCGIAGFSLNPNEDVDALRLARSLLLAIEPRGPHATGAVWTEDQPYFHKAGVTASRYVDLLPMAPTATTAALHTRYATKGDPADNRNNHPFALPGITGVHNGVIRNDDDVFDHLGVDRTAETDSEAIFALLAYDDRPALEALEDLDGDAAIAWIETDRPRSLQVARLSGRPLAFGETAAGSFLFASTVPMLRLGAARGGVVLTRAWEVPTWTYVRAWRGAVQEVHRFGDFQSLPMTRAARSSGRPGRPVPLWERPATPSSYWTGDPRDHVPSILARTEAP